MEYPAHTNTAICEMNSSGELKSLKWICNKEVYYNSSLLGMFLNRSFDGDCQEEIIIMKLGQQDKGRGKKAQRLCLWDANKIARIILTLCYQRSLMSRSCNSFGAVRHELCVHSKTVKLACLYIKVHACKFFCYYMCKPCSPPSFFFYDSVENCRCGSLENIEAATKAMAVSLIIPHASPCAASPSKERWLLGTPLGAAVGDGKWVWKKHLLKTGLEPMV